LGIFFQHSAKAVDLSGITERIGAIGHKGGGRKNADRDLRNCDAKKAEKIKKCEKRGKGGEAANVNFLAIHHQNFPICVRYSKQ